MPGGTILVAPLTAEEARNTRIFMVIGWCLGITFLTWLAWMPSSYEMVKGSGGMNLYQKIPSSLGPNFSIVWAILITAISPIIGWLLGWKAGIYPFFAGQLVMRNQPPAPSTT